MDYFSLLLLLSMILPILIHVLKSKILIKDPIQLPPGPRPFPVIGNIPEMGKNPHRALTNLYKKFGPLITLKLGHITTIVISSPEFAKEALQNHDQALSGRTIPGAARALDHYQYSVAFLPAVDDKWRILRKVITTELFTVKKLEESQNLRQRKVRELLGFVGEKCEKCEPVDIGRAAFTTSMNLLWNTLCSSDFASYSSDVSGEFHGAVEVIVEEFGKPDFGDYFPILQRIDLQGIRRRTKRCFSRLFEVFDKIIEERLKRKSSFIEVKGKQDVLDSLLSICQESNSGLSLVDVKHLLVDLFIAGTGTTTVAFLWGMTELLCNPEKLLKLKNELGEVEGEIQECDIQRLPYLHATIKETFRLHPPSPFLVPHKAENDVEIGGFTIPKDAQILVNVWAIGRDETIWKNPDKFEPERFLESEIDVKGRHFELIPFGAGRRICPGLPLAHRMLHLMLASLVHSFHWKLAQGIKPNGLDMSERFGLALSKAQPLMAVPYYV